MKNKCPDFELFLKNKYKIQENIIPTILAGILSSLGLLTNNESVILGSMLVSPILGPISYLFYDNKTITTTNECLRTIYILVTLVVLIGYLTSIAFKNNMVKVFDAIPLIKQTKQLKTRIDYKYFFYSFFISFVCGIIYVMTLRDGIRTDKAFMGDTLFIIGLGMAISVLPPLSACGIFLEKRELNNAFLSLMLFSINILGFILGGFVTKKIYC